MAYTPPAVGYYITTEDGNLLITEDGNYLITETGHIHLLPIISYYLSTQGAK